MNPVLAEIYSTIIPSAPYVLGAYVLVFIVLFVYVFFSVSKRGKEDGRVGRARRGAFEVSSLLKKRRECRVGCLLQAAYSLSGAFSSRSGFVKSS